LVGEPTGVYIFIIRILFTGGWILLEHYFKDIWIIGAQRILETASVKLRETVAGPFFIV
jgi:hypothetical protein